MKKTPKTTKKINKKASTENEGPLGKLLHIPQYENITLEQGEIIEITKDMIIGDVVFAYPQTRDIFQKSGIHCVGCYASTFETIESGLLSHGIDPDPVCKEINELLKKK